MKVLVVNCGSSSLKYQLLDMAANTLLCKGLIEKIGADDAIVGHKKTVGEHQALKNIEPIKDHDAALTRCMALITDPKLGAIKSPKEIDAVGHRVVHGGEKFAGSVKLTREVYQQLVACSDLAPLHNPPNLRGIDAVTHHLPEVTQVCVFDTAFHQSLPIENYLYALPIELYKKHGIRRYGFHGTSHRYVSRRAAEFLKKPYESLRIVTCHLGNGCSMAAIKNGHSIETSMGYTPLEGLVMGTRSGDFDPAIMFDLIDRHGYTYDTVKQMVNKKSGILGLLKTGSDLRDVEDGVAAKNEDAILTCKIICHRIKKYIGAYAAVLGGIDVLIYTAGGGENMPDLRSWSTEGLDFMGITVDPKLNVELNRKEGVISDPKASCKVMVVPTNEELVIAQDTAEIVTKKLAHL